MKVKCKEDVDNFKKNFVYDCNEKNGSYLVRNKTIKENTLFLSKKGLEEEFEIIEEKESDDMKTYKIWEVLKMIKENKKLKFTNGYIIIRFNSILDTISFYDAKNKNEKVGLWSINEDEEWRLMSNEVGFKKVLNSDKKCKVEHELLDENMDYKNFDKLICFLSYNFNERELKEIIKNGKWYLED